MVPLTITNTAAQTSPHISMDTKEIASAYAHPHQEPDAPTTPPPPSRPPAGRTPRRPARRAADQTRVHRRRFNTPARAGPAAVRTPTPLQVVAKALTPNGTSAQPVPAHTPNPPTETPMEYITAPLHTQTSGKCAGCQQDGVLTGSVMEIKDDPKRRNGMNQPIKHGVQTFLICETCRTTHPMWKSDEAQPQTHTA